MINSPNIGFHDGLIISSNQFMAQQQETAWLEPAKPSSSCIVSRFESPASAFYATERYMGLQQYDHQLSRSYQDSEQQQPVHRRNQLEPLDFKPFQLNQDQKVGMPFSEMGFQSMNDQNLSPGGGGGGGSISGAGLSNKTRIRWTQDLHEKFVECVNRLGGADKATPKAILKLMDSEGLTIFHVKSHLQKYRIAKYMPDTSEGKDDRRSVINDVSQKAYAFVDFKSGRRFSYN
ncbi:Myb family transcription factor PHL5 [Linum grandiflorum]